jgi:hypothetical protein
MVMTLLYMVIPLITYLVSPVQNAIVKKNDLRSFFFFRHPLGREQDQLEKERQANECEALEREAMTPVEERAPLGPVTDGLPGPSDHGQRNLTELELALAAPGLSPEDRKFLQQRRFQYATKMVPKEGLTTARQVAFLILWVVLTSSQEFLCHGLVRVSSRRHRRAVQLFLVQARPGIAQGVFHSFPRALRQTSRIP